MPQAELWEFHATIQENWKGLLTTMEDMGLRAPDYAGIEDGLGHYEWAFQRTGITVVVSQTFEYEFRVTCYPESPPVLYDAMRPDTWTEIAMVAKRRQTEEEKTKDKEESKENAKSVLAHLPR